MVPLLVGSLLTWTVLIERLITYRRIQKLASGFHLQAMNLLLRGDAANLRALAGEYRGLPLGILVEVALEKSASQDPRVRAHWRASVERARAAVAQDLKKGLWLLGTTANAAPFVGLFGTVVGILESFQQISTQGKGGFNTVAAGISEALIATAAGIVVAVIASIAFNALQTQVTRVSTALRLQSEELFELWPSP